MGTHHLVRVLQRVFIRALHLPQPTMSVNGSVSGAVASGSRSRPQARKKPNDDAAYFGPPTASKRQAADRAEGEPRVKRKRVDPLRKAERADAEEEKSSVCFPCAQDCPQSNSGRQGSPGHVPDRLQKLTHDHTPSIYLPFQPHTPHKPLAVYTRRSTHAWISPGTRAS